MSKVIGGRKVKPVYQFDAELNLIHTFTGGTAEVITKLKIENTTTERFRPYIRDRKIFNGSYFSYEKVFIPKPPKAF